MILHEAIIQVREKKMIQRIDGGNPEFPENQPVFNLLCLLIQGKKLLGDWKKYAPSGVDFILRCPFAEQIVKSSIPPLAVESVSWLSPVLFRAYLQNEQYWSIQKRLERSRFRQKSQIHLQIIEIVSRNL